MATKAVLKGHFNTGDTPTEAQFASLIDSYPSYDDDFAPKYKKVSVSSAEILALNTTPKELVAAPGAGKALLLREVLVSYTFVTSAYLTASAILVGTSSNIDANVRSLQILDSAESVIKSISLTSQDLIVNNSLIVKAFDANPTAGDGTLDIHLWYSEVTL